MEEVVTEYGDENGYGEKLNEHSKVIRSLVPSPVVQAIFQANLRSPRSQDIIFVKASLLLCADPLLVC